MSLRGQFFLSVGLGAAAEPVGAGRGGAAGHARASVDNEMRKALEASDRIVDNALLSLPRDGEDAYLERLVQSFDDNRHVRVALIEGGRERRGLAPGARRKPCRAGTSACWKSPSQQRIDTAPRLNGRILRVTTDAHNEISEAWTQFRDGAAILGLFSLLVLGLLHLAMARIATASAKSWAAGLRRWAAAIMPRGCAPQGPQRNRRSWRDAFNRMTARLDASGRRQSPADRADAGDPGRRARRSGARPA